MGSPARTPVRSSRAARSSQPSSTDARTPSFAASRGTQNTRQPVMTAPIPPAPTRSFNREAATIALDVGGPVPLTVITCHLDPFRPETRFAEAARIASLAVGRTAIVGGDFNCVSSELRNDGSFYDPDPLAERGWHD